MSNVSTFKFNDRPVRLVKANDRLLFVIRDICNILGFSNPNRQLAVHTENKPLYERIKTPGGLQVVRLVPREDVERLLKPNHGRKSIFLRRWLFTEVYPVVFPHLMAAARQMLMCVLVNFDVPIDKVMPRVKEKAKHRENR